MSVAVQRARRRVRREEARAQILAQANRLLRERPFRELSVEMVMAETGLSRTAFYRHFDDLADLVLRLLADVGGDLYAAAEAWRAHVTDDFAGAADAGLRGIVDFFALHGPLLRAVAEAGAVDEHIHRGYRGYLETFIEMTHRALDDLVAEGALEVPDTLALARALSAMNEHYLIAEFGGERRGDPEVAFQTLRTVWLRTVAGAADGQAARSSAGRKRSR